MQDDQLGDLATRAAGGDEAALAALVRAAAPRVRRWALVQTSDADTADDVTQEVLIRMVASLPKLREPQRIESWLFAATRNAATSLFRKLRRYTQIEPLDDDAFTGEAALVSAAPGPAEQRAHAELRQALAAAFRRLPRRQREVFDLVELQGMSAVEAAELLGSRPATVRANLFKARQTLRRRLIAAGMAAGGDER